MMSDFLVEHARFPCPRFDQTQVVEIMDISNLEVGLLEANWKAKIAVRDNDLPQKLCRHLESVLSGTPLSAKVKDYLSLYFSPQLQFDVFGGEDRDWRTNPGEAHTRLLLSKGFFVAAQKTLFAICKGYFSNEAEHAVNSVGSRVDYYSCMDDQPVVLCDAKSPSLMKKTGDLLPKGGIELTWVRGRPLMPRILTKAALYLGRRKMEWLFLTSHNHWIICRLTRHNDQPFLAFSHMMSIEDSSEPFRAFLGAILSVIEGVAIDPSPYTPCSELESIAEEDQGPLLEDDIDDKSEGCRNSGRLGCSPGDMPDLMITSSSPMSPQDFQVWVHLHAWSNNSLSFPLLATDKLPLRLWFTRFIASGSTGDVWECRSDTADCSFAAKVVEILRPSDHAKRQRLQNEFDVYLTLDQAYKSGRLPNRIAPRCYGVFGGYGIDVMILELCGEIIEEWDDLSPSEQSQVYKLVQDLHNAGIMHEVEPRNIVRSPGGQLLLLGFSECTSHICEESKVGEAHTHPRSRNCSELQTMRKLLRKR